MPDCDRTERTKQELDAGLCEKIKAMRKAMHFGEGLLREIDAIIKKKDLDRMLAFHSVPQEHKRYI